MFRTRLAALVVAGSLSFTSGCNGFCNLFCSRPGGCCGSPVPAATPGCCCGGGELGVYSSPGAEYAQPPLVPQPGVPLETGPFPGSPSPTPRLQTMPPQAVPVPTMPSSVSR